MSKTHVLSVKIFPLWLFLSISVRAGPCVCHTESCFTQLLGVYTSDSPGVSHLLLLLPNCSWLKSCPRSCPRLCLRSCPPSSTDGSLGHHKAPIRHHSARPALSRPPGQSMESAELPVGSQGSTAHSLRPGPVSFVLL